MSGTAEIVLGFAMFVILAGALAFSFYEMDRLADRSRKRKRQLPPALPSGPTPDTGAGLEEKPAVARKSVAAASH